MSDVVNLRQWRKRKARDDKAQTAQANRVKFGRTDAQKQRDRMEADAMARKIDGSLRDDVVRDNPSNDGGSPSSGNIPE